jgi:hypothetical protein
MFAIGELYFDNCGIKATKVREKWRQLAMTTLIGLRRLAVSPENAPLGANIAQGIDIFWD